MLTYQHLTDEFFAPYATNGFPEHMTELGKFTAIRSYCRWLDSEKRRETWSEVTRRAVEYNASLAPTDTDEARKLFDIQYELRGSLSGRTNWIGGTEAAFRWPLANFNCAFRIIDSTDAIAEVLYLLSLGTGVGNRILKCDAEKLPKFRNDIEFRLISKYVDSFRGSEATEHTELYISNCGKMLVITVGDSKEGWRDALRIYLDAMSNLIDFPDLEYIYVDVRGIRPRGSRLKTFGGTASGPETLVGLFERTHEVISKRRNGKLRPVDVLDILCHIGRLVEAGGVRRTALNTIFTHNDKLVLHAKDNIDSSTQHRYKSNNSVFYKSKPSKRKIREHVDKILKTGEPGFVNAVAALLRRYDFEGLNPCFEILLRNRGVCNLVTNNVLSYARGYQDVDIEGMVAAHRLLARASYRMTCVNIELPEWDRVQKEDRLCGVSITGWEDMVEKSGFSKSQERDLLVKLRHAAIDAANELADSLGMPRPRLTTTIKPEGTLSLVFGGVSPGVHDQHSQYMVRRIRVSANDAVAKTAISIGWPVYPEVGETWDNVKTVVVEIPVKTETRRTKHDVSAIEQLNRYLMFQTYYTQHNTSITVNVRPEDDLDALADHIYKNWNDIVAISLFPLTDHVYQLAPLEAITEEEYERRISEMKPFDLSVLQQFDIGANFDIDDSSCSSGACPIR